MKTTSYLSDTETPTEGLKGTDFVSWIFLMTNTNQNLVGNEPKKFEINTAQNVDQASPYCFFPNIKQDF